MSISENWDPSHVTRLVRQVFGASTRIERTTVLKRLEQYEVLRLRLAAPRLTLMLKLAGPKAPLARPAPTSPGAPRVSSAPRVFERTAALCRLVSERTALTMPAVYAVDSSCREYPWRYLLREHLAGREWSGLPERLDAAGRRELYRQLGEGVAQLHAIVYPGFGELAEDGALANRQTLADALRARARLFIPNERLQAIFFEVLERRSDWFRNVQEACLCHEDLHRHNILLEQCAGRWRLKTFLDFDKAWAGHAESDLARLALWRGMTSPDFWQAYRAVRPIDDGFEGRRWVYQLLWCLEYARPTPAHLADTRRVCQALGIPPIEQF